MIVTYRDLHCSLYQEPPSYACRWIQFAYTVTLQSEMYRPLIDPSFYDNLLEIIDQNHLEIFFDRNGRPIGYLIWGFCNDYHGATIQNIYLDRGLLDNRAAGICIIQLYIRKDSFYDLLKFLLNRYLDDVEFLTYSLFRFGGKIIKYKNKSALKKLKYHLLDRHND